jgi:DNA-binding transcriptional LysR family regulator
MNLNDVVVFHAVVQAGGFTAAARILDQHPSAVSRRVARLERAVGTPLLHRTTRRVGLTAQGRLFYEGTAEIPKHVRGALQAIADTQARPTGRLRVTAPPDDGGVIWALLSGFLQDHPDIDLHLIHTLENLDLIEHDIDVALRGGRPPDVPQFTAHTLFDSRILLAASPAYLAARGTPRRVEELADHDGLCMDPWAPNAIRRVDGDRGPVRVHLRNRLAANRLDTARRAALDGLGIAPLLELTCRPDLQAGRLVEVLRGALPDSAPFVAVTRLRKERTAAASALLDHLKTQAPLLA